MKKTLDNTYNDTGLILFNKSVQTFEAYLILANKS